MASIMTRLHFEQVVRLRSIAARQPRTFSLFLIAATILFILITWSVWSALVSLRTTSVAESGDIIQEIGLGNFLIRSRTTTELTGGSNGDMISRLMLERMRPGEPSTYRSIEVNLPWTAKSMRLYPGLGNILNILCQEESGAAIVVQATVDDSEEGIRLESDAVFHFGELPMVITAFFPTNREVILLDTSSVLRLYSLEAGAATQVGARPVPRTFSASTLDITQAKSAFE